MNPSTAATGFGLLSAASWGSSDFVGGLGSRRSPALLITAAGQTVSLALLAIACVALHIALPGRHDLLFAGIGGFEGALALCLFYHALALGTQGGAMGLTAAFTGLLTAVVPVVFSALHYGLPAPLTAAGLVAGCAAIWLITHQPARPAAGSNKATGRALLFGALAGVGFGTQLILFKMIPTAGILAIMTVARVAGIAALLLVILASRPSVRGSAFWRVGAFAGLLDTTGNLFYLSASRLGRLDAAAVVCSLYPAATMLLAALLLHERPSHRQLAGMALALGAVALLSL